jgi:hypothetical protein
MSKTSTFDDGVLAIRMRMLKLEELIEDIHNNKYQH